jgi:hypothetical protein
MALRLVCTCGYVVQGVDDDEFCSNVQAHLAVLHPELVGAVTREDLLAQAEVLALGGALQQPPVHGLQGGAGRDPQLGAEQDS